MDAPLTHGDWPAGSIFTIGHSTRPLDEFVAILRAYEVRQLADIRTVPRSRHNPQFNADTLAARLPGMQLAYLPMPALGGLRHAHKDSPNMGWRNASFRGYADYMQTPEFADALDALIAQASARRTAIMCAEAVPWRCHRSLVGDALLLRGVTVIDILSATNWRLHALTRFARVDGLTITYPPETEPAAKSAE